MAVIVGVVVFPEIEPDNAHPDGSLPEAQSDTRVCVTWTRAVRTSFIYSLFLTVSIEEAALGSGRRHDPASNIVVRKSYSKITSRASNA